MTCLQPLKLLKTSLLVENELSRGRVSTDRMLFIESLLKNVKIASAGGRDAALHNMAEEMGRVLIKGRTARTKAKMHQISQDLRKCRKQIENMDFSVVSTVKKMEPSSQRAFNRPNANTVMRPLLEPMFNVLELQKQMLLLQDHLSDRSLRCPSCIIKHTLFSEALIEEALGLDCVGKHCVKLRKLLKLVQQIRVKYMEDKRNAYSEMVALVNKIIEMCRDMIENLSTAEYKLIMN